MSSAKKDWKKHFHRMKQIADQNLGRAEKSEVLNEDLVLLEKRVSKIKTVCQNTIKKLTACLPLSATANPDKNIRKLPESILALTMMDSVSLLGDQDTLGKTYGYCAKLQSSLAKEIFHYAQQIEKLVLTPMQSVLESEIPVIVKLRKQLTKLTLDMDSVKGRFLSVQKQAHGSSSASLACKVETLKNELDQAENRVQQCRDQLVIELYAFLAREGQLSDVLLTLVTSQIDFHRRTLESLESSLPQMKYHTEVLIPRPVFGCSLVSHLEHARREIAVVIEKCIHSLILHGINEEGLFRVASSSTKVKKLKAGFDASIVNMDDYQEDAHCIAAVLKSYLRELPEPLMTFELYSEWMHIMELPTELRQNALWVVVDKLPKPNYDNLRYIIKFLAKLAANSDVNKMSPSNIAIVIGPNLLWAPGDDGPSVLTATSHSAIIECLINKSEWFFPGDLNFGVTEADWLKTRLKDSTGRGHNLSSISSSALTPAYISKHRFFGNVFDESDHNGLKASPSSNRLSLNSLTSLNDESSFERKYSFSSLLEERTSTWDSEGGSMRWPKLSRVESGTSSLNTSFSYGNRRSPIPSSSTSPALSTSKLLSFDGSSSVTRSPTLSVTTCSSRLSGSGPSVNFGVGSLRLSGTMGERCDSSSKIPTMLLSANKNTIPLVSIARASTLSLSGDGTLTRNNGFIGSSPPQSFSMSSDVSQTCRSVTTGSTTSTSIATPDISLSVENSEVTVSTSALTPTTAPYVSLTAAPVVSVTTISPDVSPASSPAVTMSENLPAPTTSIPTLTQATDSTSSLALSQASHPALSVTSSIVSDAFSPSEPSTTSPVMSLTMLPSTSSICTSEDGSSDSLTPETHRPARESNSGNPSHPISFSRHVVISPTSPSPVTSPSTMTSPAAVTSQSAMTSPSAATSTSAMTSPSAVTSSSALTSPSTVTSPSAMTSPSATTSPSAVSDTSQQTADDVFNSVDASPGCALSAGCLSDARRRTRVSSEGSWVSIPNGDCGDTVLSFGRVTCVDNPNARRGSDSGSIPGKERVRFQGLGRQTGFAPITERPTDRRLSIPSASAIYPEAQKPKQPVKKTRSLSITSGRTLPYAAPNYPSSNANPCLRRTSTPSDRRVKGRSDGNIATPYEKNGEALCNDKSVIRCTRGVGYLSRNALIRQECGVLPAVEGSPTHKQNISGNSAVSNLEKVSSYSKDSPTHKQVVSGNSTVNPSVKASEYSDQSIAAASGKRGLNIDSASVAEETALSSDGSDKPKANGEQGKLPIKLVLCGVASGSSEGPPSPSLAEERISPNRTLQRPLFPPPPVPDVPTKNSATSD